LAAPLLAAGTSVPPVTRWFCYTADGPAGPGGTRRNIRYTPSSSTLKGIRICAAKAAPTIHLVIVGSDLSDQYVLVVTRTS